MGGTAKKPRETSTSKQTRKNTPVEVYVHKMEGERSKRASAVENPRVDADSFAQWKAQLVGKHQAALQKLKQQKWTLGEGSPSRTVPFVASRQRCYIVVVPYGIPQRHTMALYPITSTSTRACSKTFDHNVHISPQSYPAIRFGNSTVVQADDFRLSKHRKIKIENWHDPQTLYAKWIEIARAPDIEAHRPSILTALKHSIDELLAKKNELLFDVYLLNMPALEPYLIIPTTPSDYTPLIDGGGVHKAPGENTMFCLNADGTTLELCSGVELDYEFKPMKPAT